MEPQNVDSKKRSATPTNGEFVDFELTRQSLADKRRRRPTAEQKKTSTRENRPQTGERRPNNVRTRSCQPALFVKPARACARGPLSADWSADRPTPSLSPPRINPRPSFPAKDNTAKDCFQGRAKPGKELDSTGWGLVKPIGAARRVCAGLTNGGVTAMTSQYKAAYCLEIVHIVSVEKAFVE